MFVLMCGVNVIHADDVADVKAAVVALFKSLNETDADAFVKSQRLSRSWFGPSGALLVELGPADRESTQADWDKGWEYNISTRHIDVKVYGDVAVVTGYLEGRSTSPDGTKSRGTYRMTLVWVKRDGQWNVVHRHQSQLEPTPREVIRPGATDGQ
jgi:ketosteroid isomerase-like protein